MLMNIYSVGSKSYGSTLGTLPTPTRPGYNFKGWFTSPSGGTQITSSTTIPAGDKVYYALWEQIAAPTISVVNKYPNGSTYSGAWTNQSLTSVITYSAPSGTTINPSSLAWSCDGTNWSTISNSNTSTFTDSWGAERNNSACYYRICNTAGVCGTTPAFAIRIDKTVPSAPTAMEFVYGDWSRYTQGTWTNQSVYAGSTSASPGPSGATDNLSGVLKYQISSDNSNWVDYSYAYSASDTIYSMHSDGTHTRYFRAVDNAGNVSSSISRTAKIDKTAPTIGTVTTDGSKVYVTVSDSGSKVSAYYTEDGLNDFMYSIPYVDISDVSSYNISFNPYETNE